MSSKVLAWTTVIALGFSTAPAQAAGKLSDEDILTICGHAAVVCKAACIRKDNFSGQLSSSLCEDQCNRTHDECIGPVQGYNNGVDQTTGVPNGTLEQGQKQKKKKRKKAPTQP